MKVLFQFLSKQRKFEKFDVLISFFSEGDPDNEWTFHANCITLSFDVKNPKKNAVVYFDASKVCLQKVPGFLLQIQELSYFRHLKKFKCLKGQQSTKQDRSCAFHLANYLKHIIFDEPQNYERVVSAEYGKRFDWVSPLDDPVWVQ